MNKPISIAPRIFYIIALPCSIGLIIGSFFGLGSLLTGSFFLFSFFIMCKSFDVLTLGYFETAIKILVLIILLYFLVILYKIFYINLGYNL